MKSSSFTFYIHFINITNYLYSKTLQFSLGITYKSHFRLLESSMAECTLDEDKSQKTTNYFCETQLQNTDIKEIKLQTDFNFTSQDKVLLVGITPIAKINMNDIQKIDDELYNILESDTPIFILDNCTIFKYENNKINISGIINGDKPKSLVVNKNLTLMTNIENNNYNLTNEIKCIIKSILRNNYVLNCEINYENKYNLQSAVSIITDGILLINFENTIIEDEKAEVTYKKSENDEAKNNGYFYKKSKSKGINVGVIIGIIVGCVVLLGTIIFAFIYLKKRHKKKADKDPSSSEIAIKTIE